MANKGEPSPTHRRVLDGASSRGNPADPQSGAARGMTLTSGRTGGGREGGSDLARSSRRGPDMVVANEPNGHRPDHPVTRDMLVANKANGDRPDDPVTRDTAGAEV